METNNEGALQAVLVAFANPTDSQKAKARESINDLDYTHPKGIVIQIYFSTDGRLGWIAFAYDANPHLLDRLYG